MYMYWTCDSQAIYIRVASRSLGWRRHRMLYCVTNRMHHQYKACARNSNHTCSTFLEGFEVCAATVVCTLHTGCGRQAFGEDAGPGGGPGWGQDGGGRMGVHRGGREAPWPPNKSPAPSNNSDLRSPLWPVWEGTLGIAQLIAPAHALAPCPMPLRPACSVASGRAPQDLESPWPGPPVTRRHLTPCLIREAHHGGTSWRHNRGAPCRHTREAHHECMPEYPVT